MLINGTLCYCFGRLDIILKNSITSFYLFVRFIFNFIILRSRVTSIWYQSMTSIRDKLLFLFCINLVSEPNFDPKSNYFYLFQVPISIFFFGFLRPNCFSFYALSNEEYKLISTPI